MLSYINKTVSKSVILSLTAIVIFSVYFSWDIINLKKILLHPDFYTYYYSFRYWFSQELKEGHFPLWNPYWGLGQPAEVWATIPIDIYTVLEVVFGPKYHLMQGFQAVLIPLTAFIALYFMGSRPIIACGLAIIFFLSPWTTYFYFYFMHVNSIACYPLFILMIFKYYQTNKKYFLNAFALIVAYSMLGTKPEIWFYQTLNLIILISSLFIISRKDKNVIIDMSYLIGALILGICINSWQLKILLPIFSDSGRINDHSFSALYDYSFWKILFNSIFNSLFVRLAFICIIFGFIYNKLSYLWNGILDKKTSIFEVRFSFNAFFCFFLSLIVGLILVVNNNNFVKLIEQFWLSSLFYGLCLSIIIGLYLKLKTSYISYYFMIACAELIYYYSRTGHGDLGEVDVLARASIIIILPLSVLIFMGWRKKVGIIYRLAVNSIFFIFIMREQGQVILSYLFGLQWIPTRDNYIVDFCFILIASESAKYIIKRSRHRGIVLNYLPILCVMTYLFRSYSSLYSVHDLISDSPRDYPYYTGYPPLVSILHEFDPNSRLYFYNDNFMEFYHFMGTTLLMHRSQVTMYSSLTNKRYREWSVYHNYSIKPEEKWHGYSNDLSDYTLSLMPTTNTLGYTNSDIYSATLISRPPNRKELLEMLGVDILIHLDQKIEGAKLFDKLDTLPNHFDLTNNDGIIKVFPEKNALVNEMYIEKLQSIPKTFIIEDLDNHIIADMSETMDASASASRIKFGNFEYNVIEAYKQNISEEKFHISTNSTKESVLIISQLFTPYWTAYEDGNKLELFPMFHIFTGVKLTAGNHKIQFQYKNPGLNTFFIVSLALIMLTVVSGVIFYRRSQGSNATRAENCSFGVL